MNNSDFEHARDKVMMGSPRKNMVISEDEKKATACHEAGHTVVGRLIAGTDPVHKVTIIPRGPALGVTMTLPTEDRYTMTKEKCEGFIAFLMAGVWPKKWVFGHITSGASNDIERATELARKMVTEWGMSAKLGPMNFGHKNENVFLGREMSSGPAISSETARMIDDEVRVIVEKNYERAKEILTNNRDILEAMTFALLDRETIELAEIDALMNRQPMPPSGGHFAGGIDCSSR